MLRLHNGTQLLADVRPNRRVTQRHAVVAVNRAPQPGCPSERVFGRQLDRLDAKQGFRYFAALIQG